jgi:hypothetical protein
MTARLKAHRVRLAPSSEVCSRCDSMLIAYGSRTRSSCACGAARCSSCAAHSELVVRLQAQRIRLAPRSWFTRSAAPSSSCAARGTLAVRLKAHRVRCDSRRACGAAKGRLGSAAGPRRLCAGSSPKAACGQALRLPRGPWARTKASAAKHTLQGQPVGFCATWFELDGGAGETWERRRTAAAVRAGSGSESACGQALRLSRGPLGQHQSNRSEAHVTRAACGLLCDLVQA